MVRSAIKYWVERHKHVVRYAILLIISTIYPDFGGISVENLHTNNWVYWVGISLRCAFIGWVLVFQVSIKCGAL